MEKLSCTYPARFEHVDGRERRESDSPSWFNSQEVDRCKKIVDELLAEGCRPEEIGVITAFEMQSVKLRCALGWDKKSIGSVTSETFANLSQSKGWSRGGGGIAVGKGRRGRPRRPPAPPMRPAPRSRPNTPRIPPPPGTRGSALAPPRPSKAWRPR